MSAKVSLTVPAETGQLPAVLSFVEEQLEKAGCSMKTLMQINVAVEELFVNIANYAYPGEKGEAAIFLTIDPAERILEIEFRDRGVPFDPLGQTDPDISLPAEERNIGGLGIFMAKKIMDGMRYVREDGQNILKVTKKL